MLWPSSEGQSISSKRRQGFQPCFEAGIIELPFLMPEPVQKPSLHSYLCERYGSSTQMHKIPGKDLCGRNVVQLQSTVLREMLDITTDVIAKDGNQGILFNLVA